MNLGYESAVGCRSHSDGKRERVNGQLDRGEPCLRFMRLRRCESALFLGVLPPH